MSSQDRSELIRNAVHFLSDSKSQSSSLVQRIQFLEAKGLTPLEIEEALRQASVTQNAKAPIPQFLLSHPYALPQYPIASHTLTRPPLDWRDYFILAVISGGVVSGALALARKYLLPHLQPPSVTAYESDRDALNDQFDAAEVLLKEVLSETAAVRQAVEEQKLKVEQTTQDVESCVKEMHEGEIRTRDEMREMREEIDTIRDMLPKMIEKNKESQTQSLAELQQELKSLKALLLSRGPSFLSSPSSSVPSLVGRPAIPPWQLASNANADSTSVTANGASSQNAEQNANAANIPEKQPISSNTE